MNLPIELKTRIYEHIGTVQSHLAELPADEQREILQALEAHIYDALESRSGGNPTVENLEAIIAEMNPPESYGPAQQAPATHPHPGRDQSAIAAIKARSNPVVRLILALIIAFISFFLIIAGVSAIYLMLSYNPTLEQSVNISPVGSWKSIDFVEDAGQFDPSSMHFQGELYLKGLTFLEHGKTSKPWWTWKGDILLHHGDKSAAQFSIQIIDGTQYMFLEWISGDVLEKGMPPEYYVLKRGEYADPGSDQTIVAGVGCGAYRVGATREEMIAALGEPDPGSTDQWLQWKQQHHIHCLIDSNRGAFELRFDQGFNGKTAKGIGFGSTENEAVAAYGKPSNILDKGNAKKLEWSNQGILMWLTPDSGVHQIVVFNAY